METLTTERKNFFSYLRAPIFSLFLGIVFFLPSTLLIFNEKIEQKNIIKMEFFLFAGFTLLCFVAYMFWSAIFFASYKKMLFGRWIKSLLLLFYVQSRFLILPIVFFVLLLGALDLIFYNFTSKYILFEVTKVMTNEPLWMLITCLISLFIAIFFVPWKDLRFGLLNRKKPEKSKSWRGVIFCLSFFASFYILVASLSVKYNVKAKEDLIFQLLLLFPIFLFASFFNWFLICNYAYGGKRSFTLLFLITRAIFVLFLVLFLIYLLNFSLSFNKGIFNTRARAIVHFFRTIFLPIPVWSIIVITSSLFVISLLCMPWKEIVSRVRESLQRIAIKIKGR